MLLSSRLQLKFFEKEYHSLSEETSVIVLPILVVAKREGLFLVRMELSARSIAMGLCNFTGLVTQS